MQASCAIQLQQQLRCHCIKFSCCPPSSYVVCVTALLTCCRAVEQIKGVYCSAQPALYGICSTASQFESVSLVYCLEALVCAFFYKVSALRLKPFESSVMDFSITNLFLQLWRLGNTQQEHCTVIYNIA